MLHTQINRNWESIRTTTKSTFFTVPYQLETRDEKKKRTDKGFFFNVVLYTIYTRIFFIFFFNKNKVCP